MAHAVSIREHIAPQFTKGAFSRVVRATKDDLPDGVTYAVGINDGGHPQAIQAVHFDADLWPIPQAMKWLRSNQFTAIALVPAGPDTTLTIQEADSLSQKFDVTVEYVDKDVWKDGTLKGQDKQMVFGWLYVCRRKDGSQVVDHSGDIITMEELEQATYGYVRDHRGVGQMHEYDDNENVITTGKLIECMCFTPEKKRAMGIPDGTLPDGTFIGQHIEDREKWLRFKSGELRMFSLGGRAIRRALEKLRLIGARS